MIASWLAGCLLVAAATALSWPATRSRARRRLIIGGTTARSVASAPAVSSARTEATGRGQRRFATAARSYATGSPRLSTLAVAGLAAGLGMAAGGPVAATAAGAYGGLAARIVLRRQSARNAMGERVRQLDGLCALAADLRAGLPVPVAAPAVSPVERSTSASGGRPLATADRLAVLTGAVFRLAERTGAPLADLVERVEADARAMDRALSGAAAQAAGARATAWLLAGLPLGGIALGYGIGVDPLAVLLHTPIGAGCAVAAIVLQFAGLAWADRLSGSGSRAL